MAGLLDQTFPDYHFEDRQTHRTGDRSAAKSVDLGHTAALDRDLIDDAGPDQGRTQRRVTAAESLGQVAQVGYHPEVFHSEKLAGPAGTGDDLVGDEEYPVTIAGFTHLLPVRGGRHRHAGGGGHRLGHERRHGMRSGRFDGGVDSRCRTFGKGLALQTREGSPEVDRRRHLDGVHQVRVVGPVDIPAAGHRQRPDRGAVIAGGQGHDLGPLPVSPSKVVLAGYADGQLVGLRPAGGEHDLADSLRCQLRQSGQPGSPAGRW